ncbi:MAG: Gmad2 immunoglobulin-like domain-containing protein [Patescibacteria group bacterium]|nr:Gmad2 immunoglobulin-like domain-containing protein [Patescibacteria group bacterium]
MRRFQFSTSNSRFLNTGRILPYVFLVGGVVLAALAVLFFSGGGGESAPADSVSETGGETASGALDTSLWETYQSDAFGFSIKHPAHWEVRVSEDEFTPAINIFDPATAVGAAFPLTHFSEATHVSMYPRGIPTEGVFSNTRESGVRFGESVRVANDFLLEDGSAWATAASFGRIVPAGWDEAGFLWAKVVIDNLDLTCRRGVETVPVDVCDPLSGDTLVRRGTVNARVRAIEEAMLASFHYLNRVRGGTVSTSTDATNLSDDLIRVTSPEPGAVITSPLTIRGEARGNWYFEATFPVVLVDWDGRIIAEHYAEAKSDWMTTDFVPFEAMLEFVVPDTSVSDRGALILRNANPSGLPDYDAAIEIPVRFVQ